MTQVTTREGRKFRRDFRRKGYWPVYHEVSGYPAGKRELGYEWLREQERASDRRKRWTLGMVFAVFALAAIVGAYLAAMHLGLVTALTL